MARPCPSLVEYQQLTLGQLPDSKVALIEEHLERCAACVETARNVLTDQKLMAALEAQAQPKSRADKEQVDTLIDRLLARKPSAPDAVALDSETGQRTASLVQEGREVFAFLTPPEQAGELGRLGSFRILRVLGKGGMGVVFEAEDLTLKRTIALKTMKPSLAADASARQRFLREAQSAAKLNHDHIVSIYRVGQVGGVPFLAMPLLKGQSLHDRLRGDEPLSLSEILRIGKEIAEGLAAAHEVGLIHRDIKPANIWLESREPGGQGRKVKNLRTDPASRVKLLDFGLARPAAADEKITESGAVVGSPAYMSPEQARAETLDFRTDLFSLGCVLYRLCTHEVPFQGKDLSSALLALATQQPPAPRKVNGAVPARLSSLVMKLLAKKATERPTSARAVADLLADMEAATAKQEAGAAGQGKRPVHKAWIAIAAASLFMLTIVIAGIVFWVQTPSGTVRVEINDPAIKVAFDKGEFQIQEAYKDPLTVSPGDHGLRIKKGDFDFETTTFTVKKGTETRLKIDWLAGKVRIDNDGKVSELLQKTPEIVAGAPLIPEKKNTPVEQAPSMALDGDPDQRAATWVLASGGILTVTTTGRDRIAVKGSDNLPGKKFQIIEIRIEKGALVTNSSLEILESLKQIQQFTVFRSPLTDDGLAHFEKLNTITHLNFIDTQISGSGLEHLKGLSKNLVVLNLATSPVTDPTLANLEGMSRLSILSLEGTRINGSGLAHLKGLNLIDLNLVGTRVDDKALEALKDLPKLARLHLPGTKVTDAGLPNLRFIDYLNLGGLPVSDKGVDQMKNWTNLRGLYLEGTGVTQVEVTALKKALPKCDFGHWWVKFY